jgi:peptide/nickel transport system substrate-binding protein
MSSSDTFVLAEVDEITSLDPAYSYDNASQNLIFNVYDTLIGFDKSSFKRLIPLLAVRIPSLKNGRISPDGRVYRFRIRQGVRFQDGSKLSPQDVRYSLLRFMMMDRPGGPSALLLEPILGISSTRDDEQNLSVIFKAAKQAVRVKGQDVVITLQRPFAPFLSIMARWSYVLPQRWAKEHGDWDGTEAGLKYFNNPSQDRGYLHAHMNGSGPFKFERWNPAAKYVILDRNDGYWRKPADLKRVIIKTVTEFSTQKLMLETGDVDAINVSPVFLRELEKIKGVKIADHLARLATDPVFFFTFKINPTANRDIGSGRLDGQGIPPDFFLDPDVRKGFAYAFDYNAFIQDALKGQAQRAKTVVPPELLAKNSDQHYYHHDIKKSAAHFRKAFQGKLWEKGFHFTMSYNIGSENRMAAVIILKKNVEAINPKFQIDIRGLDWAPFLDKAEKHLMPIFVRGWYADYPDAYNFVSAFYASKGRYPIEQGYSNPAMDILLRRSTQETNPRHRRALYAKILSLGFKDAPNIFISHPYGIYALRDEVQNFYDNPIALGLDYYYMRKANVSH